MGKTRTGKTTVAKVFADPCYVPPQPSLYSSTKEVTIHSVTATMLHENRVYCFNVVDPPGWYAKFRHNDVPLTNEQIKASINECIKKDVTNIHIFAFVISLQHGVDDEDIQSMVFVMNNYKIIHPYICLLVTHCEEYTPSQREMRVAEFFQCIVAVQYGLNDFFGNRVFYMGALRPELRDHPHPPSVRAQMRNISQMRETFLNYIVGIDVKKSFNIHRVGVDTGCSIL